MRTPRSRIIKTIIRGCRRLVNERAWPSHRQLMFMARHRGVTAAVLQEMGPPS